MHRKYSVADLTLLTPFLLAVFLAWWMLPANTFSNLCFVAMLEFSLLIFGVRLLSRNFPAPLKNAAEQNCFRLDGTRSRHRSHLEAAAAWKLRTDVLAILLIVVLTGNGLALAVHCFVIPIPLGLAAMMSFRMDRESWKDEIATQNIDLRFKADYRERHRASRQETDAVATELWSAWPLVVCGAIGWAIGMQVFATSAYRRALADYSHGIARRAKGYTARDVTRLQHEFEAP